MHNVIISGYPFITNREDIIARLVSSFSHAVVEQDNTTLFVLYHKNCNDGFVSALLAKHHFNRATVFIPVQYGEGVPKELEASDGTESVLILDFSFSHEILNQMADKFNDVMVVDHHKTFIDQIKKVDEKDIHYDWVFSSEEDKETWLSGAAMFNILATRAWGPVNKEMGELVAHTSFHDTWKHGGRYDHPSFRVQAGMMSMRLGNSDNERLEMAYQCMCERSFGFLKLVESAGAAVLEENAVVIRKVLAEHAKVTVVNHNGKYYLVAYCELESKYTSLASQFYHSMFPEIDFNASLSKKETDRGDVWVWSLRTERKDVPLGNIAKSNGGGGHSQAAAFSRTEKPEVFELN